MGLLTRNQLLVEGQMRPRYELKRGLRKEYKEKKYKELVREMLVNSVPRSVF